MKKVDNEKYQTLLTGYIDGELDEQERAEIEELLESDSEFRSLLLAESKLKDAVKTKVGTVKAPGLLRTRVERQLFRKGARPSFWELVQSLFEYRPIASSFAVAMLVLLTLLPVYRASESSQGAHGNRVLTAQLTGEIICLDCDVFSRDGSGVEQHQVIRHPGVRTEDGSVWTILPKEASGELRYSRELLKRRGTFKGVLFQNAQYIRVNDYKLL